VLRIINEPTAAALSYGLDRLHKDKVRSAHNSLRPLLPAPPSLRGLPRQPPPGSSTRGDPQVLFLYSSLTRCCDLFLWFLYYSPPRCSSLTSANIHAHYIAPPATAMLSALADLQLCLFWCCVF
jgi:hypothetical protein